MHLFICLFLLIAPLSYAHQTPIPQGFYSSGSLLHAWELPLEGDGYMRLFLHRNRGWGTRQLIELLQETAAEMNQLFPMRDRLQVGDLSAVNGGRISRHNSHQNGLDVDLTYYRLNGVEQLPDIFNGFEEDMVLKGKISPNFDHERNWEFIKALHRHGRVQRIFVDRVIKAELCLYARARGEDESHEEILRSLRHVNNHIHHMHVRPYCPKDASDCVAQNETPPGSGCP
jgi:penicillin-insensitive murein DD-endopeptidase